MLTFLLAAIHGAVLTSSCTPQGLTIHTMGFQINVGSAKSSINVDIASVDATQAPLSIPNAVVICNTKGTHISFDPVAKSVIMVRGEAGEVFESSLNHLLVQVAERHHVKEATANKLLTLFEGATSADFLALVSILGRHPNKNVRRMLVPHITRLSHVTRLVLVWTLAHDPSAKVRREAWRHVTTVCGALPCVALTSAFIDDIDSEISWSARDAALLSNAPLALGGASAQYKRDLLSRIDHWIEIDPTRAVPPLMLLQNDAIASIKYVARRLLDRLEP